MDFAAGEGDLDTESSFMISLAARQCVIRSVDECFRQVGKIAYEHIQSVASYKRNGCVWRKHFIYVHGPRFAFGTFKHTERKPVALHARLGSQGQGELQLASLPCEVVTDRLGP